MANARWRRASQKILLPAIFPLLFVMFSFVGVALAQPQSSPPPSQTQTQTPPKTPPPDAPKEDSLAEAARKLRAKKGIVVTPKHYTDDDVSHSGGAKARPCPQPGMSGEECWRWYFRELHYEIDGRDQEIARLKDDIKKNGNSGYEPQIEKDKDPVFVPDKAAKIQKLEKEKEDWKRRLKDWEEEGRKSGWFH